ncbi:hypothetical protein K7X08_027848 [Anisodus acutangulus]|uniref:Uncharacterized protein n=1 Tax=Anisodus acutangulus TaxID=402998 RepID=A0A9Q1MTL9_9SOLA|nr:hypothetical protein K7X08_027848 [Anisodus acutangulus]
MSVHLCFVSKGMPRKDIEENSNCMLIVTPKGVHLGWVAGPEAPRGYPWTDPHVMDFLEHLEHGKSASAACASDQETMNSSVTNSNTLMYRMKYTATPGMIKDRYS